MVHENYALYIYTANIDIHIDVREISHTLKIKNFPNEADVAIFMKNGEMIKVTNAQYVKGVYEYKERNAQNQLSNEKSTSTD